MDPESVFSGGPVSLAPGGAAPVGRVMFSPGSRRSWGFIPVITVVSVATGSIG